MFQHKNIYLGKKKFDGRVLSAAARVHGKFLSACETFLNRQPLSQ